ncbi:uncharacterized protein LOC106474223 [Limulus polyphemus]|uniref:Uncharacterized protein LOC106474223 n=1 Tax=Limulus polyphemus TaxID=6850 RepID=A0ABM1BX58_LIMPO|nr:uncharacterized protein LOC106474223 [Limulus polyphemus]
MFFYMMMMRFRFVTLGLTFLSVHLICCRGESLEGSQPEYVSQKSRVSLTCNPDEILVNVVFNEPFHGVIHAGDKGSSCKIYGTGDTNYSLHVPFNDCGTKHVCPAGSFSNVLTIRFHGSLELDGDEIKTIVCRFGTGTFRR